jgi:hypothetical protein
LTVGYSKPPASYVSSSQELQDGPDVSSESRKLGGATSESSSHHALYYLSLSIPFS